MKVTSFILDYLVSKGVRHVFGITGGYITPLFDAFHGRTDIQYICMQNEQAAAMAADAYARITGFGCAISTSGPGATNLITGIGCSYFDSVPVLFLTGQVPTGESKCETGVRQRGFQETDVVKIVRPITKYTAQMTNTQQIGFLLDYAYWQMTNGRPGPALLDMPMDIQMADIDPATMNRYHAPRLSYSIHDTDIEKVVGMIAEARRPVIIYGQGARHATAKLVQFIEMTGIPCLPSWAALDMIPHDHPLFVSQFGVYGSRAGNFTVQNADLIIAIGTRLDGRMTGKGFAPKAKTIVVDIDPAEAQKHKHDVTIIADAGEFLDRMNKQVPTWEHLTELVEQCPRDVKRDGKWIQIDGKPNAWRKRIADWKVRYPITASYTADTIHPLTFIRALNDALPDDAVIVSDSGANMSWVHQAWKIKGTQRLFSAYGYSPMGYALPAAIGAYYATGQPVIAINGDGSMQMNIQELQTLKHYNIPVKLFILNNLSYGIIKQFQEELYDGRYEATDEAGGYSVPDFVSIAHAYGLHSNAAWYSIQVANIIKRTLGFPGPVVCDIEIDQDARIFPKTCYGQPLHNQSPLLDPSEVEVNMADE